MTIDQNLLNKYSISEVISIFSDIDEKIISLHKCSSEDFLGLNDQFKKSYKEAKIVADNAAGIFEILSDKNQSANFLDQIESYHQQLSEYNRAVSSSIGHLHVFFERLSRNLDLMFVSTNNFNQNLMSLKLLATNLKLNNPLNDKKNNLDAPVNTVARLIDNIKIVYNSFTNNLEDLKENADHSLWSVDRLNHSYRGEMDKVLSRIKSGKELLSEKNKESMIRIPELTKATENSSQNIAKIITNLQYHDIIRQKIEHVQRVHKEILNELSQYDGQDTNSLSIDGKMNCYIKIRDIAGLQASQLLHANKEYQNAIETITQRLLDLGDNMNSISDMCEQFTGDQSESSPNYFEDILRKLQEASHFKNDISNINMEYLKITENAITKLEVFGKSYGRICDADNKLQKVVASFLKILEDAKDQKTVSMIQEIIKDIEDSVEKIGMHVKTIDELKDSTINNIPVIISEEKNRQILEDIATNSSRVLSMMAEKNTRLFELLKANKDISGNISLEIKQAVADVKYYEYFDNMIEKIIAELNSISTKLSPCGVAGETSKESLERLKQHYTMQSEHAIHEYNASKHHKGEIDIFEGNSVIQTNADDDDNLELF